MARVASVASVAGARAGTRNRASGGARGKTRAIATPGPFGTRARRRRRPGTGHLRPSRSAPSSVARAGTGAGARDEDDAPVPELARLAKLLRVNAGVELAGAVAVAANPASVFPGIAGAGIECSRWYALALGSVALASFLASELDVVNARAATATATPVVRGMLAYHVGIAAFQVNALAAGAWTTATVGATLVHGCLAAAFALAAAFCAKER